MDNQMWLAMLGGGLFAGSLIAVGFFMIYLEERKYRREKKNGST